MKRALGIALGLVLLLAAPASAGRVGVNVARHLVHPEAVGARQVIVEDVSAYTVEALCAGRGSTWFTVRVRRIASGIHLRGAYARGRGDCSGKRVTLKRRVGRTALVKVRNVGDFDCTYKRAVVSWTGPTHVAPPPRRFVRSFAISISRFA
jgi:hypothetical protein